MIFIKGTAIKAEVIRYIEFQAELRNSALATARTKKERERIEAVKNGLLLLAGDLKDMHIHLLDTETARWD